MTAWPMPRGGVAEALSARVLRAAGYEPTPGSYVSEWRKVCGGNVVHLAGVFPTPWPGGGGGGECNCSLGTPGAPHPSGTLPYGPAAGDHSCPVHGPFYGVAEAAPPFSRPSPCVGCDRVIDGPYPCPHCGFHHVDLDTRGAG